MRLLVGCALALAACGGAHDGPDAAAALADLAADTSPLDGSHAVDEGTPSDASPSPSDLSPTGLAALELRLLEGTQVSAVDTSAAAIAARQLGAITVYAATSDFPSYTHYATGVGFQLVDTDGVVATGITLTCKLDGNATTSACTPAEVRGKSPDFAIHELEVTAMDTGGDTHTWKVNVADTPANYGPDATMVSGTSVTVPAGETAVDEGFPSSMTIGAGALLYLEAPPMTLDLVSIDAGGALFSNAALVCAGLPTGTLRLRATARAYVFGAIDNVAFHVEPGAVVLYDSGFGDNTIAPYP